MMDVEYMWTWLKLSRVEILLWTRRFKNHRKAFFIMMLAVIAFLNIFLNFGSSVLRPALAPFAIYVVPFIAPFLSITLMFVFVFFLAYPVQHALQVFQIEHLEILLSAPVRPRDVFFGEYFGHILLYMLIIFILAPFIVAGIGLFVPISLPSQVLIILFLSLLLLSASFLGTCLASFLSMKFGTSARKKDLGKVVPMVISLGLIVPTSLLQTIFWSVPSIFLNPMVKIPFQFFPSTWFANLIAFSISPSLYVPVLFGSFELVFIFLFMTTFLLLTFGFGFKFADKFFSLDRGKSQERIIAKDHFFYRFFRRTFGVPSSIQAKEFFRRNENLGRLAFFVGFSFFLPIIMTISWVSIPEPGVFQFMNSFNLMLIPLILAMIQGLTVGSFIMVRAKDMVWLYKKSPKGVRTLVLSFYSTNYLVSFLLTIPMAIIASIILRYPLWMALLLWLLLNLWELIIFNLTIGIQCYRPAFEARSTRMSVNIMISMGLFMGLWLGVFMIFSPLPFIFLDPVSGMVLLSIITPGVMLGISTMIFLMGIKKLEKYE